VSIAPTNSSPYRDVYELRPLIAHSPQLLTMLPLQAPPAVTRIRPPRLPKSWPYLPKGEDPPRRSIQAPPPASLPRTGTANVKAKNVSQPDLDLCVITSINRICSLFFAAVGVRSLACVSAAQHSSIRFLSRVFTVVRGLYL